MYRYTIKREIDGAEVTFMWESKDEYEIGDQVYFGEEGGEVIYDKNGEEVNTIFPRPVYATVVAKERIANEGQVSCQNILKAHIFVCWMMLTLWAI
jgi:hypothetical protein